MGPPLTHALSLLPSFILSFTRSFHTGTDSRPPAPPLLCLFTYGSGIRGPQLGPQHPLWQLTEAPGQFAWPRKGTEAGELEDKGRGAGVPVVVLEAPNATLIRPDLSPRDGLEMGWGQGGMEESQAFSLEEMAVGSPCSASPLFLSSLGVLSMVHARQPLGDIELVEFPKLDVRPPEGCHAWQVPG